MLTIRLLGPALVEIDRQALGIRRRKSRALLFFIAGHPLALPRARLLSVFWPDLERGAAQQSLRTSLYGLRQELGGWLEVDGERVGLAEDAWVDARRFGMDLSAAGSNPQALEQALEHYRGDFLQDFILPDVQPFEDWLTIERERFRRMLVKGLSQLSAALAAEQEYAKAVEALERALASNPLQEDLQREVIRLVYLAGDRPGAIRRYDELRRLLDEQMGVPPMHETRSLYDAILLDRLVDPAPAASLARQPEQGRSHQLPTAPQPTPPGELPFSGRGNELGLLRNASLEAKLILIQGEPGIGKTRLAEEFSRSQASQSAVWVLTGHGRELEQVLPYHPVIEALRSLAQQAGWQTLWRRLQPQMPAVWLAEVSRLLPELAEANAEKFGLDRPAEEARLWEGVRQFLILLARNQPLIFFLDDLHWADVSTLGLLGYLVRQAAGSGIAFLATSRPLPGRSPGSTFVQSMQREGRLRRLEIERLTADSVAEIARGLSPQYAGPLAEWLWKGSEGNPFILSELARDALEKGLLTPQGALNLNLLSQSPLVPQNVYGLIQSRLASLSGAAQRVLDAAVAAGREFDFGIVMQAAGLSESAALDALDELQAAGLVHPCHRGSPDDHAVFTFDHALTLEVAYREVGEPRHRLLHRRIAEVIEARSAEYPERVAGELAWHFGEGNASQRAAPYALIAGRQAAELAAWNEAAAFYNQALQGMDGNERLAVMILLAEVFSHQAHYSQASETLRAALSLAQTSSQPPAQINAIQIALARTLIPQARYAEVIQIAEGLCGSDLKENAITAQILWGTALSVEGADLHAAEQHLRAAQSLLNEQPSPDLPSLALVKFELGGVLAQLGDLVQAVDCYRQTLEVIAGEKDGAVLEQRILAYNNLAYHLHLLGDPAAEDFARQGLCLAQEKGVLGLQAYLYSTCGEIAMAGGDLDQAEKAFEQGLAYAEQAGIQERVAGLTANLGLVARERGESALAIYRLSNALGQADALGTRHLSVQIRLWLAPLLPLPAARQRLEEARRAAEATSRQRLLEEVQRIEKQIAGL